MMAAGIWTRDLLFTSPTFYQLTYKAKRNTIILRPAIDQVELFFYLPGMGLFY